jgi:hypothetical protein
VIRTGLGALVDRGVERLGEVIICGRDDRLEIDGAAEMVGRGDEDRVAMLDREGAAELRAAYLWIVVGRGAEKLRGWTRLELGLDDRLERTLGERVTLDRDRSRAARSLPRMAKPTSTPTQRWIFR